MDTNIKSLKMFEARFYINPNPDFVDMPCFSFIKDDERVKFWMLGEIVFCDNEYIIDDVLPNLEKVMSGELTEFEFGYDSTIIDFNKNKSIINYNYFEDKIEVPSESIYHFMKAWGEYLKKWREGRIIK